MKKILLIFIFSIAALYSQGRAQILLTIDDSDPSHVQFTATGSFPSIDATTTFGGMTLGRGELIVDLAGFFTTNPGPFQLAAATTTLTLGDSETDLNLAQENFSTTGPPDLLLAVDGGPTSQTVNIVSGQAAFSGSATFDFSGTYPGFDMPFSVYLPAAGTSGSLYLGDNYFITTNPPAYVQSGTLLGSWAVVTPEPSTILLCAAGLFVLSPAFFRRKSA